MNNILMPIILLFCLILLAGCPDPVSENTPTPEQFSVTSSSFTSGGEIAEKYCNNENGHTGTNISPQLSWTGAPEDTISFVLIMDDDSAGNWSHWILYYIPPNFTTLPEGLGNNTVNCLEGAIDGGYPPGYKGPYPPSGTHNYYFRVYALDTSLMTSFGSNPPTRAAVITAMNGHILAEANIIGTHSGHL